MKTGNQGIQQMSSLAIASLVMSLWPLGFIGGIICGHVARWKIKKTGMSGASIAQWGLVLSYLFLLFNLCFFYVLYTKDSLPKNAARDGMTIPYDVEGLGVLYSIEGNGLDIKIVNSLELIVNNKSYGALEQGDDIDVYSSGSRQWIYVNNKRIYKVGCPTQKLIRRLNPMIRRTNRGEKKVPGVNGTDIPLTVFVSMV